MVYQVTAENVNDAYQSGLNLLKQMGRREDTRNGPALVMDQPVVTQYSAPWERVLFDEERDANPFLHLFEAIWMLAGRNDAAYLVNFAKNFANYAEPDGRIHGAYGHRWREHFDRDQLDAVVSELRRDSGSRQAVLTMWDPDADLGNVELRDRPCNTHVYFRLRPLGQLIEAVEHEGIPTRVLDMTVCCRSNDMVWGAYGANAVHFSFLLEYMACRLGVSMGTYYQVSNNFHGYNSTLDKLEPKQFGSQPYAEDRVYWVPAFTMPETLDQDIRNFMRAPFDGVFGNQWFHHTAQTMLWAHRSYKSGDFSSAFAMLDNVQSPDWRIAAGQWLARRQANKEKK